MTRLAIAFDLGTSGFRAQALDLFSGETLSTAMTTRHPLPGANVIDHLHFALDIGVEPTQNLVLEAVNRVLAQLRVPLNKVERLAVCGNPTQLSLFQGMEIRDLAFAGSRHLDALGVKVPARTAAIRRASEFPGLHLPDRCEVVIPPAVRDEVGADALALILQTGMLQSTDTAIAIDYGTNAEMALIHQGHVYTGSAAAGPALEGQHIACGMLAAPGVIADVEAVAGHGHRLTVLDSKMRPQTDGLVDLREAAPILGDREPSIAVALTGTGTIAAIDQAMQAGLIELPAIRTADRRLHFGPDIFLGEDDLAEAGKAIGAIRAGYSTLCAEAGLGPGDIRTAYLAGASGTYMSVPKALRLGLIPPRAEVVHQAGNTSLAMARELALHPQKLETMRELALALQETHRLFAQSKAFSDLFLLELSHWTEGMPMGLYRNLLCRQGLPDLPPVETLPHTVTTVSQDIGDLGLMGLVMMPHIGREVTLQFDDCIGCMTCVRQCPAAALDIDTALHPPMITLAYERCNGVACRRCEPGCPTHVFRLDAFFVAPSAPIKAEQ
jgi:methylamine methyltransferase corrinoid protein reductive activase